MGFFLSPLCYSVGFPLEWLSTTDSYRMTDALQKLFGSPARVKLLRLFLFNPRRPFTLEDITDRSRVNGTTLRKEIDLFSRIKMIKRARGSSQVAGARFMLNESFEFARPLQSLLLNAAIEGDSVVSRFRGAGNIKLLILAGVFAGELEGSLDILVVGDRINDKKLRERVRKLESDLGRELRYATLTSPDFHYRLSMSDHMIRDILDFPHRILVDKLQIGLK